MYYRILANVSQSMYNYNRFIPSRIVHNFEYLSITQEKTYISRKSLMKLFEVSIHPQFMLCI